MSDTMFDVALFPIPNVVAFPGTTVPLHVFEPRYRTMVTDAVDNDRLIAVCHTRKEISSSRKDQSVEDALNSNQATYMPHEVFSAGHCEIVETTADGRIYVNINMSRRLRLVEDVQTLPYRIARCEEVTDEIGPTAREAVIQQEIISSIEALISRQDPAQRPNFDTDYWLGLPTDDFSFQIFQLLRFDAETMQAILESTSVAERLQIITGILGQETGRS